MQANGYRKKRQAESIARATQIWLLVCALRTSGGEPQVLKPVVTFIPAPLVPTVEPPERPSVLMGFSPFYAGDGLQDVSPLYQPIREGGFRIAGSSRRFNRSIIQGQNIVWTGDVPLFQLKTYAGPSALLIRGKEKPVAFAGKNQLGTLQLGVPDKQGKTVWLDTLSRNTTVSFFPGYTEYRIVCDDWNATLRVAPADGVNGLICRIAFDRETPLVWRFGDVTWGGSNTTFEVSGSGAGCRSADPEATNLLVQAGWDGRGKGRATGDGRWAEFVSTAPGRVYHIVAAWGLSELPKAYLDDPRKRLLESPAGKAWPAEVEKIYASWLTCYAVPASRPEERFYALLADPAGALEKVCRRWEERRRAFQIRTPSEQLDAVMNWTRAVSDYHLQGPSLYLGPGYAFYGHTSVGWYGKEWGGDHAAMEQSLRLYATAQGVTGSPRENYAHGGEIGVGEGGWIGWLGWNLHFWLQENNTPYWVDQVWQHYRWTGNKVFVRELWPFVQKAVGWECAVNDPDGDGLFVSAYPFWNADSYAGMSKAVGPTATGWRMLDAAAGLAEAVGDVNAAMRYRGLSERSRSAALRELWHEKSGLFTSLGSDGLHGAHPYSWEVALAVNGGILDVARGSRSLRWLESRYGFEGLRPEVRLLMCGDLWPLRWSNHWVSVGDTLLAVLAGMKCGDVDLWWPYLETVVRSSFRSRAPGINFAMTNAGMGCGDFEDVDSDDPHPLVAVRGLFGIEPAVHQGRMSICPAFPKEWTTASIRTPDVSYDYRREGDQATFVIRSPRPLVKCVRANLTGEEVVTAAETESRVTLKVGPALPAKPPAASARSVLANRQPVPKAEALSAAARERLLLLDLSDAYTITAEQLMTTPMLFDNRQTLLSPHEWWVNPTLMLPQGPRLIETGNGVKFLTAGCPEGAASTGAPKSLVALSSWRPYPWPAGAVIPVGRMCERLWLLTQNYVHPSKCYQPNGEVIVRYANGKTETTSLVPPYNMDTFYQVFSREGMAVSLGAFGDNWPPKGFSPATMHGAERLTRCHATALEIKVDPLRVLEAVELRATCGEGILGLAGMTLLQVP